MEEQETIIQLKNISKAFKKDEQQDLLVLKNVNFTLRQGEIVALLGKSGSGKSTLLRIIAGLIQPSHGEVFYRNQPINGPALGISMVFQDFALLPWLTVLKNVELGLEARGVPRDERLQRALKAIDIIGLDGFESAYPKELSGGMRQRVGLARALVVDPDILLMDEPFSSLDVLTAENLKSDLLDLWYSKQTHTNGILLVTHNIEEAVMMADRILIFASNPGFIQAEIKMDMPHPRNDQDPKFREAVDKVYAYMTAGPRRARVMFGRKEEMKAIGLDYQLPDADISELIGLMETLVAPEYEGNKVELPELAESLHLDINELFPLTEVLEVLGFARIFHGNIELTAAGKDFVEADILIRKTLFASHLRRTIPLVQHIRKTLDEKANHRVQDDVFLLELQEYFSEEEAQRVLKVVIEWCRYAEIFAYDSNTGTLSLENP